MQMGGLDLYFYAADEAQAKKPTDGADLDSVVVIIPKVPLLKPAQARKATYRLKLKDSQGPMPDLPETDMQKILARGPDYMDLAITRQDPADLADATSQKPPPALAKYLESSLYVDWQSPAVKAAAEGVACDSEKPWDLALALWKYVDKRIYIKSYEIAFDPASNVLATGKGDCTEHAVLLAALARARGLPSRIVSGITQVPGSAEGQAEFGYHAWTEVWIDGVWVSLDAALRQAPVDVSHIALAVSAAEGSDSFGASSAGMTKIMGNLEIEVLSEELAP